MCSGQHKVSGRKPPRFHLARDVASAVWCSWTKPLRSFGSKIVSRCSGVYCCAATSPQRAFWLRPSRSQPLIVSVFRLLRSARRFHPQSIQSFGKKRCFLTYDSTSWLQLAAVFAAFGNFFGMVIMVLGHFEELGQVKVFVVVGSAPSGVHIVYFDVTFAKFWHFSEK